MGDRYFSIFLELSLIYEKKALYYLHFKFLHVISCSTRMCSTSRPQGTTLTHYLYYLFFTLFLLAVIIFKSIKNIQNRLDTNYTIRLDLELTTSF